VEAQDAGGAAITARHLGNQPTIEFLLRQLVEQVSDDRSSAENGREVLIDTMVDGYSYQLVRSRNHAGRSHVTISPREAEIVRLVAKGLPNKAIASVLDVSLWTVATHLRRVFTKLGVNSRAEMVALVISDGILDWDDHGDHADAPGRRAIQTEITVHDAPSRRASSA
jgi:DNA-binding CsgD family transcriptional regulator